MWGQPGHEMKFTILKADCCHLIGSTQSFKQLLKGSEKWKFRFDGVGGSVKIEAYRDRKRSGEDSDQRSETRPRSSSLSHGRGPSMWDGDQGAAADRRAVERVGSIAPAPVRSAGVRAPTAGDKRPASPDSADERAGHHWAASFASKKKAPRTQEDW